MSVFQNIYTQKYQELDKIYKERAIEENIDFLDTYMTTLINTFEWKNIPEYIPRFSIESRFQYCGRVFAMMKPEGLKIYGAFPGGRLTDEGEFDKYYIIKPDGSGETVDAKDGVIGFNCCFKIPYFYKVQHFAEKSSYALQAVDSALAKAIMPTVFECDGEESLAKLSELTDEQKRLHPFIATLKAKFDKSSIQRATAFDNRENDVLSLWDVYVRYRNLFYTTFGINNVEIQKRERLTQAEGSGNDEIVRYSLLDDMFKNRKDFANKVNAKFGTNIEVELNRDSSTVYQLSLTNKDKIESAKIEMTKGANIQEQKSIERGENNENKME